MEVNELRNDDRFTFLTGSSLHREVEAVYIGDLLSWVMGRGPKNAAWLTVLGHLNVVAVASLREFSMIIICEGAHMDSAAVQKAEEEGIVVVSTKLPIYEVSKILAQKGL